MKLLQHPVLNEARAYWQGLAPRERLFIGVGGVFLLLALVYALLWLPMQQNLRHLRQALPEAERQLALMRAQSAQAQQLKGSRPAGSSPVSLQTAVEQTAGSAGLQGQITRLETRGPKTVEVALDAVAFNSVVRWLADLQKSHPVQIETATIERQTAPGVVNVRLTLRAVGS